MPSLIADIVKRADAGMIQRRDGTHLVFEALLQVRS